MQCLSSSLWLTSLACVLTGCGGDVSTGDSGTLDTDTPVVEFELIGSWEYTGGFPGLTNLLEITEGQFQDTGDYMGTDWDVVFSLESWDNEADQALLKVASIEGFSHYELEELLYMSWQLEEQTAKLYFGSTDFLEPTGGTEGEEFVTYTRLD